VLTRHLRTLNHKKPNKYHPPSGSHMLPPEARPSRYYHPCLCLRMSRWKDKLVKVSCSWKQNHIGQRPYHVLVFILHHNIPGPNSTDSSPSPPTSPLPHPRCGLGSKFGGRDKCLQPFQPQIEHELPEAINLSSCTNKIKITININIYIYINKTSPDAQTGACLPGRLHSGTLQHIALQGAP
jgi:hypothetical protein